MTMEPINLKNLNKEALRKWLDSFDVILTDCDAALWHDNEAISQVPETINALQSLGKKIYFVTNNGTKTRQELWQKAAHMHFHIVEQQIIAPAFSVAAYLKQHLKPDEQVYVIGSKAIAQELDNLNIKNFGIGEDLVEGKWLNMLQNIETECRKLTVGAVVVGFDDHFSFVKMLKASRFLMSRSCHFLCTNSDAVHRYPNYSIPGTGAILKALETCVEREAEVMGKPNSLICKHLIRNGIIKPARTLMIGDSPQVDVLFGKKCGFSTLLVGTGCHQWPAVEKLVESNVTDHIPNYYTDSLADLYRIFE